MFLVRDALGFAVTVSPQGAPPPYLHTRWTEFAFLQEETMAVQTVADQYGKESAIARARRKELLSDEKMVDSLSERACDELFTALKQEIDESGLHLSYDEEDNLTDATKPSTRITLFAAGSPQIFVDYFLRTGNVDPYLLYSGSDGVVRYKVTTLPGPNERAPAWGIDGYAAFCTQDLAHLWVEHLAFCLL